MQKQSVILAGAAVAGSASVVLAATLGVVGTNVLTDFNEDVDYPRISRAAHVHEQATVIGDVTIGSGVFVAPHAFVRGDEGQGIFVGADSNIQDAAGIHGLETEEEVSPGHFEFIDGRRFSQDGDRLDGHDPRPGFSVYVSERVSIAHQALVHGPAWIGHDTFVGLQAQVFNARVGNNVAIAPGALVVNGVSIPDDRYVPFGAVIDTQEKADALGPRVGSPLENTNDAVVHVNTSLARGYNQLAKHGRRDE